MRAARFHAAGRRLELEEVAVPEPGPADVLVRVEACGICLSDVHLIEGGIPPIVDVVIPGHEACGRIAKTGDLVKGFEEGQRVSLMGGRNCGSCVRCLEGRLDECLQTHVMGFHYDGAWAEYVVVPWYTATPVPDHVLTEHAAIIADLSRRVHHALRKLKGEQGEVLHLRFIQHLNVAETAAVMGKTEGAIKALQYRALRSLQKLLPEGLVEA
jgi:RNA polymerase sigma factor (sigma-70 family)